VGLWLELVALHVNVYLLSSEAKRFTPFVECFQRHAQNTGIEGDAGFLVRGCQHEMVKMMDHRQGTEGFTQA
jgi:hypothetical protein